MDLASLAKQMNEENDMTQEERSLCNHVRSLVTESRAQANRIAHEGIWMTNVAYMVGTDSVFFNAVTRQFQPVNRTASYLKRQRVHVNKILPTVQIRLSKLCQNPPRFDVLPESNSTEDKEAARLAQQTLMTLWTKLGINRKRIPLYMWTQQVGHAYVKVCWDPTLGNSLPNPQADLEEGEENEKQFDPDEDLQHEGEVRLDVCSAFEIHPDPLAKDFDDLRYLIQAKIRSLDYFRQQYPKRGHLVKEEDVWLLSSMYESRINTLNSRGPSQGGLQDNTKGCAIELIKYERPTSKYPQGRMIVTAHDILLEDKPLPVGEIPFVKFDDILIAGKYYSEAVVTHLRSLQDQYNEIMRRRAEWTRNFLAGKYLAARGTGLMQEALNDQNGEVVEWTPVPSAPNGGMPTPIQIPQLPQWAYEEEKALDNQINYISGISEVSRGILPSSTIPAIGMQLLQEADASRLGVITENLEHGWAKVGSLILKHVEKFYVTPRKLKIAGPNLSYAVKNITGEDLKGNTDVLVVRGSMLPDSKTLRRQDIMNAFQTGLLGDPQDPKVREKVLSSMEFGDIAEVWVDYGLDMDQIRRGLEVLEKGQLLPISEFDNHALWVQELNRFRKGDRYQGLPNEAKKAIEIAMEAHIHQIMSQSGMITPQPPSPQDMGPPSQGGLLQPPPQPGVPPPSPPLHILKPPLQ